MATVFLCGCLGCFIKIIGKNVYVKDFIELPKVPSLIEFF